LANNEERFYLRREERDLMVEALDEAREQLSKTMTSHDLFIPSVVCDGINKLLAAVQFVLHRPPFLERHEERWNERNHKKGA
jgi:hypothetical protein